VYKDDAVLAFLDINPVSEGHLLVIPRDHYALITDMPAEMSAAVLAAVPVLGRALLSVTGVEGFNVLINQGPVAGQVVPHVHCHLIPRKAVDGLGYRWMAGKYPEGRADELAQALRKALAAAG
jgi:histidine triad (HIT) family protein